MPDPREYMRGAAMALPEEWAHKTRRENRSAARCKAFAFLGIMHPELSLEARLRMAREIAEGR